MRERRKKRKGEEGGRKAGDGWLSGGLDSLGHIPHRPRFINDKRLSGLNENVAQELKTSGFKGNLS